MFSHSADKRKKLVIVGGGFAATTLAQKLERELPTDWDIYLLTKTNFISFSPLLPEVIGASLLPGHVQAPIRLMLHRVRIRMVTVDEVDIEAQEIFYHNDEYASITYDQLVFCPGVKANLTMIPGMQQYSLPLKTVGDAVYIRNTIVERLEAATIHPVPVRRKELTTFIVIGGGFSGVETAGEIDDLLKVACKYYKNISYDDCAVILLHGSARLLPELSERLGRNTEQLFAKRNIDVRLNVRANKIESRQVTLSDGSIVRGATIISSIGTTPHSFISNSSLYIASGKIEVNSDMSIKDCDGLWAMGDCATVPNGHDGKNSPPTAQFADRQAKQLANNIIASFSGKATRPFSYRPLGMMASVGHNKAVAELFGVSVSGFAAFLLWRGTYLIKFPGFGMKVRLFLEWTWSMFFTRDISHLGFVRSEVED